jgi:predicted RecB family nuclease
MQTRWEVLRALVHCRYKAWLMAGEEGSELLFQVDGDILQVELPVKTISPKDKLAALAWFYGQENREFKSVTKLVLHSESQTVPIRLAREQAKARKFLKEARTIIDNPGSPVFYRNSHCPVCPWRESCMQKLRERDCISLLGGMSPGILAKYHKKGIFSVLQLSHLFRPRRRGRALPKPGRYPWELKALAIREQKTYVLHKPELGGSEVDGGEMKGSGLAVYIDMEGLPDENFIYLVGGVIVRDGKPDGSFSFWADDPSGEEGIFRALADVLASHPGAVIYHYGSYETKALKRWPVFKGIEKRMINLLGYLRTHVFPPTYGNGLKEVAGHIGFTWTDEEASGLKSIGWRKDWEGATAKGQMNAADMWKGKLVGYNLEDARALIQVKEWMDSLAQTEIKKYSPYQFRNNPEFGEDFQAISKAAYFDYQRDRIYWRKGGAGKKSPVKRKPERQLGKGVVIWQPKKANEIVEVPPLVRCPHCGHKKLYHSAKKRSAKQTDLRFTPSGIKQWIREFQSGSGKCAKCAMKYNDSVVRMVHFGDNLFAWAVNLYVNYNLSHEMISRLLEEQFGIYANRLYFMQRKEKWFEKFLPDVDRLRKIILESPVIHVDETRIKLSQGSGYVWVFATTDAVFYHLTLTRESDFLREWLKDYTGILVTDFFPGYEALPFGRQKCLIHLIRDLNDDLFKNPFDEEYKTLVLAFGKLLRGVVGTIDRFGLKKRHLFKHEKDLELFRRRFLETDHTSELSIKYAKRLQKHWAECWTFLRHDGVPWNNNNAEVAIKAFAIHRRGVNGQVTERRLREYLNMLSLAQTCRYRNMSFLDFLRGKAGLEC